jgi:peptidoglycan/LPS O-acetylase OafA/YrhL
MRIKELDGLRGLAVLAVINQHYLSWFPATGSHLGWLGVDLFFILSGFLITTILVNLRSSEHYFSEFYARRALRIFPPYFLGIAIYLGYSVHAGRAGSVNLWMQYLFYYTSLGVGQPSELNYAVPPAVMLGLGVLWSLSVEEIYYTLWAPLVRWTSRMTFTMILIGMVIVAPLLRWLMHTPNFPELYTFYCRMDALAMGSLLALVIGFRNANELVRDRLDRLLWLAAIVIGLIAVLFWGWLHGNRSNVLITTIGVSLADLSFALMTYTIIRKSGSSEWSMRLLRQRWLRSIGMISYSLYLFHYPILSIASSWVQAWGLSRRPSAIVTVLVASITSLLIAYGLWYGLESPILRWKDRHIPSRAVVSPLTVAELNIEEAISASEPTMQM